MILMLFIRDPEKLPSSAAKSSLKVLYFFSENIAMLTTVLTDKLTKNKKVFGSTLDKILEVDI